MTAFDGGRATAFKILAYGGKMHCQQLKKKAQTIAPKNLLFPSRFNRFPELGNRGKILKLLTVGKMRCNRDMEIEKLKKAMANVEGPCRTERGNIRHKLEDILIIGLCALISNGNDFVDMEAFGKQREEWLRGFLALPNGMPDSDAFRRVFDKPNPEALSECLCDWLECNREEGSVIAVDGKPFAEAETKAIRPIMSSARSWRKAGWL